MKISEFTAQLKHIGLPTSLDFKAITKTFLNEVHAAHAENHVFTLVGQDKVRIEDMRLELVDRRSTSPKKQSGNLFKKQQVSKYLEITESHVVEIDANSGQWNNHKGVYELSELDEKKPQRPYFLSGYKSWEEQRGHYDPLTEIFHCGLYLASIAFGLDFEEKSEMARFANNREQLHKLNNDLHPSILNVIRDMTTLYREDRLQTLEDAILRIEDFSTFNPELNSDLTTSIDYKQKKEKGRKAFIMDRLKSRLYDISRRNRLIYHRTQKSFVNLTVSSVPLLLDYRNIDESNLFYWSKTVRKAVVDMKKINLNKFLHLKDTPYVSSQLDRIRLDARKSVNEYGFSQLRLVVAYLHWFNLKENKDEKIQSPLLLLPVNLNKAKGVKDRFEMNPEDNILEVNPVLSHYLKDLYDIKLPERLDLNEHSIEDLINDIRAQIERSDTGIEIEWKKLPRIELIHSIAKKNFSINIRKSMRARSGFRLSDYSYSYADSDFRPLGLEIFNKKVRYRNNQLEYLINEDLSPEENHFAQTRERSMYSSTISGTQNPYKWEIDTCNMTIGNFNYRKMSLVNDYEKILEEKLESPAFSELFSEDPKILNVENVDRSLLQDYSIIDSDPTQSNAVAFASSGKNYIIQGPPGTGKSQTITNLIASFIAQDKKVLFICEKRAALDVVFHRLKQKELDELCCLVHDSQSDKKSFIMDLKETYESFLQNELDRLSINKKREALIGQIDAGKSILESYHQYLSEPIKDASVNALHLLETVTGYTEENVEEGDWVSFPDYSTYAEHKTTLKNWIADHENGNDGKFLKDYPLIRVGEDVILHSNAFEFIDKTCSEVLSPLDELNEMVDSSDLPESFFINLDSISRWMSLASNLLPLVEKGNLDIFDTASTTRKQHDSIIADISKKQTEYSQAAAGNGYWKEKLSQQDTESALTQWNKYSSSPLRFLTPGYYKLKKLIKTCVNMSAFKVEPDFGSLLDKLNNEYNIEGKLYQAKQSLSAIVGGGDTVKRSDWIRNAGKDEVDFILSLVSTNNTNEIKAWASFKNKFDQLSQQVILLDSLAGSYSLSQVETKIDKWRKAATRISTHLPYLKKALTFPETLKQAVLAEAWTLADIEYAASYKTLKLHLDGNARMKGTDAKTLLHTATEIKRSYKKLYELNVQYIRSSIREDFASKIELSERSVRGMSDADRDMRKQYREARKILENEFSKSMRYKSIRELSSGDARHMLIDLKPVWLMSPLSVSDVLALDTNLFDVVIFDEASQITLEEGIPALFRSTQAIIVGDEMQMPPTNFFSTSSAAIDEEEEEFEKTIGINLDADSLLNQGSRKLSSVMLGWHYRSRHESLISFCNAAFYDHQLLTIPDVRYHKSDLVSMEELVVQVNTEEATNLDAILSRSISYHHLSDAVYSNRSNTGEADYIARIVRDIIRTQPELTIGVVAFSMQQQGEIESALERLARIDSKFEEELEQEYSREEDNQMVGLFVKNLENVQGDERDVIIMSVCYGVNEKGKMLMNFGPINRRGGEKRLNVIFSRAKRHMMVVSSIEAHQIKNDYNEGALYFKRFLEYARHISEGNIANAQGLIQRIGKSDNDANATVIPPAVSQLKTALISEGLDVDDAIGQSRFKVSLAVRNKETSTYRLGIVIDDTSHYDNSDVVEQYCQKPQVLHGFGWDIYHLYTKDWYLNPKKVIEEIKSHLSGKHSNLKVEEARPAVTESITTVSELSPKPVPSTSPPPVEVPLEQDDKTIPSEDGLVYDRLEFTEGSSNKFWEVAVNGASVEVRYGRIGNKAQTSSKAAASEALAVEMAANLKAKKLKKGYKQM